MELSERDLRMAAAALRIAADQYRMTRIAWSTFRGMIA